MIKSISEIGISLNITHKAGFLKQPSASTKKLTELADWHKSYELVNLLSYVSEFKYVPLHFLICAPRKVEIWDFLRTSTKESTVSFKKKKIQLKTYLLYMCLIAYCRRKIPRNSKQLLHILKIKAC